ncbi:TonB-dependent receptor [Luteimonas salinilitoris]|uniref:TonB-dependent receptor n=1 Tax=Luteimonas salinilitoris TaxID=3237697 RepID=A0ABV4HSC8_9GAMM
MTHALCRAIRHSLLATALAGTAPAVLAQEPPATEPDATTLGRIEVTGSRILRTDTETASPVQLIQREDIDRSGERTLGEYLQTLTVDGSGSVPKSFGAGFASGASGISMRGLGAGSTLVLINGRRIAPYGLADDGQKVFTDLSIIPLEAVERVEVLKDGASSIYGSDAIAGVVNVILRRDFTGTVLTGSYGMSEEGDGDERKASVTWGTGDLAENGYNFFFSVEASKSDEIFARDRRGRKWIGTGDIRPWGYDIQDFGGITGFIPDGGTGTNSPVGNAEGPDGWASLDPSPESCALFSSVTPQDDPNGGCMWDTAQIRSLQPEQEYINFFSRGTFALSDTSEIYTEFGYGRKKSSFHNTPSGVSGAWASPEGGAINASSGEQATVIGAEHPDNPFGVDARLRYAAFDVGSRRNSVDNQFVRFLVGVRGYLGEWDYDVGYLHSETDLESERRGYLRYSAVQTVLTDPDSPVGWWRLGANAGENSQALYDFISPTIRANAETKLDAFDIKASRSLMDLPGGALGLAVGAEWRRQTAMLTPVTFTDQSEIIGLGYSAYDGDETVTAAYVELLAPVHDTLELSGALRMDDYRDGDTAFTPKFGVKWTPIDWIALRGTYAEGFRAPNPAETAGSSVGFATANDPVRCSIEPRPSNCPPGVAFINRPNPDLEPEESKSYTVGLVLQPTQTTTLTLDAWQIERENEITTRSLEEALRLGDFIRDDDEVPGFPGSGTLLAVFTNYINASATTVRGLDLDVRQSFDLGNAGTLALDLQWSRINSYERDSDGTVSQWAGTHGDCNVTNCIGTPKDRINFGATWDINDFSLSSVVNYRGEMDNVFEESDERCASTFADGSDAPGDCEIPSFYTVDLSGSWRATEAFELFGSVQNVTDRVAPLDPTTYGALNYNPLDFSGAMGRYFTLGMRYTFL